LVEPANTKSLPTLVGELRELVVSYARQQTVDPLKGLARFVIFGVLGSVMLATGLVLLVLGGLRALQTETGSTFDEDWSWAPYGLALLGCVAVVGAAVLAARRRSRP
jgi:hypothetical protein